MSRQIILASASATRQLLLRNAGLSFEARAAKIDEATVREAMLAEGAPPRDVADKLAELKAFKIASREPAALVIGCDQVLNLNGELLSKPASPDAALAQLRRMRGKRHDLLSAAVICEDGRPVWRHVGMARLTMREFTDAYLEEYIDRNWESVRHSVGAYKLEEEGVRLFSQVQGDYFTVLGLPLLDLLSYLTLRGVLDG